MDALTQPPRFAIEIEWDRAPGVASPELAATWCSIKIRLDGETVSLVEDRRSDIVRSNIFGSAYPLAEWFATHWAGLSSHLRPSAVDSTEWSWTKVDLHPWLRNHNLRGAGDGMAWPDLTIVPEGGVTRVVWHANPGLARQPLRFLTSGDAYLPEAEVKRGISDFIRQVLDRLSASGIAGTSLQTEWAALAELTDDESEYVQAIARLGLDPFDVEDALAEEVEAISYQLERPLFLEFLDSVLPEHLPTAFDWFKRARDASVPTRPRVFATVDTGQNDTDWERGYALARLCRSQLGLSSTESIPLNEHVGVLELHGNAAGIRGVVHSIGDEVGVVLPEHPQRLLATTRFAQARAWGLSLLTTRDLALLDPTRTRLMRSSRAFAAELLAPAEGVAEYLKSFNNAGEGVLDAIAARFDTSPLVVKRQRDNQIAHS